MNKPILTIGIPTYNDAESLKKCLSCITVQFDDKNIFNYVEVFISDNASQDDTRSVVETFQRQFSNIRYARNKQNLGFDRNVDTVLRNAMGLFCWTLSSNEYLEKGSIEAVLLIISSYPDIACICVSNLCQANQKNIRYFKNGNEWLAEMGVFGGQISQCIFNMQYMIEDRSKYYDSAWPHLALFWEMSAHRSIVLAPCLFKILEGNDRCKWASGGTSFITYINLKKIVSNLPKYGFNRSLVDRVLCELVKKLPRNIASAKRYGLPVSWKNLILLMTEFKKYPFYLSIALIVFLTPSPFLRMLKKMK